MKVYKDDRGEHDLERQIERLKLKVRDLEKLNKDLTKELEDVRKTFAGISTPIHGRQKR